MGTNFKSLIAVLVTLTCFSSPLHATEKKSIEGFQVAKFGQSYNKVKELFPALLPAVKNGRVQFATLPNVSLIARNALAIFRFIEDELYEVAVVFTNSSSGDSAQMEEFVRISDLLASAYGKPKSISMPRNAVAGHDFTALKIRSGDLFWNATWKDSKSSNGLSLELSGNNHEAQLKIFYSDKKREQSAKRVIAKSQSDEL